MQLVLARFGLGGLDSGICQRHLGVTPITEFHLTPSVTPKTH